MLEMLAMGKLAAAGACVVGAAVTWKQLPEPRMRTKLRKCFHAAELYVQRKQRRGESRLYPSIPSVRIYHDRIQIIFILPLGLDPSKVWKSEWTFRQQFGENMTLEGDDKRFTLSIYHTWIESFPYDYDAIQPVLNGLTLPIVVGQSRQGYESYDMAEHPHLLVSGETGSGKSVWLRSCLTTIIKTLPEEKLHLYLADLKLSEFHLFDGLPHVKMNEWEPRALLAQLKFIKKVMASRGKLCKEYGVPNVLELPEDKRPPFIIVCIDEVALLKDNDEVMSALHTIGAIGRSNGVFLILSMQRPDSKLLDSSLKQCLTVRLSFRQYDEVNSRIAVDVPDAAHIKATEKGRGVIRLDSVKQFQSAYLDMKRARKLLEPIKKQLPKIDIIDIDGEVLPDDEPRQDDTIEP